MSRPSQNHNPSYLLHDTGPPSLPTFRAVRHYVTHLPVKDHTEAKVLSRQAAWDILAHIRSSGPAGVSAGELSSSLDIPLSDVYSVLRDLAHHELIFKVPRARRIYNGRRKHYVSDKVTWKKYTIDRSLKRILEREGILSGLTDRVEQPLMETLTQAVQELERTEFGSVLPNPGRAGLCPRCGMSHEALDFFNALMLALLEKLMEGTEFKALLSRLGYSHRNQ